MDGDPGPWMAARRPRMRSARPARAAVAAATSMVLHLLFLTAMVLGLRVIKPPPESPAIELQIVPPFTIAAAPRAVAAPKKERPVPRPALKAHVSPLPPTVSAPPLTLPAPAPHRERAGPLLPEEGDDAKGIRPSLTGRLGCDDPMSFHLTDAQKARCENNVGAAARAAKSLNLDIADAKLRAYDRAARCHAAATGAMPASASGEGASKGLGYVPSLKECPPGDR